MAPVEVVPIISPWLFKSPIALSFCPDEVGQIQAHAGPWHNVAVGAAQRNDNQVVLIEQQFGAVHVALDKVGVEETIPFPHPDALVIRRYSNRE